MAEVPKPGSNGSAANGSAANGNGTGALHLSGWWKQAVNVSAAFLVFAMLWVAQERAFYVFDQQIRFNQETNARQWESICAMQTSLLQLVSEVRANTEETRRATESIKDLARELLRNRLPEERKEP